MEFRRKAAQRFAHQEVFGLGWDSLHYVSAAVSGCQQGFDFRKAFDFAGIPRTSFRG